MKFVTNEQELDRSGAGVRKDDSLRRRQCKGWCARREDLFQFDINRALRVSWSISSVKLLTRGSLLLHQAVGRLNSSRSRNAAARA